MNFAHLHLILNHLPLLTMPIVLIFLAFSMIEKTEQFKHFSILMTLLTSISVLPVFFTGEPAEEIVEKIPSVSKSVIHEHEEFAEIALVLTLLVCLASLIVLLTYKNAITLKFGIPVILLLGVIAIGSLAYTANLGGKIRHTELAIE